MTDSKLTTYRVFARAVFDFEALILAESPEAATLEMKRNFCNLDGELEFYGDENDVEVIAVETEDPDDEDEDENENHVSEDVSK